MALGFLGMHVRVERVTRVKHLIPHSLVVNTPGKVGEAFDYSYRYHHPSTKASHRELTRRDDDNDDDGDDDATVVDFCAGIAGLCGRSRRWHARKHPDSRGSKLKEPSFDLDRGE